MSGYLISIDGIDGVGKATQSKLLNDNLNSFFKTLNLKNESFLFSFPFYHSFSGRRIKDYLNTPKEEQHISLYQLSTLFAENRLERNKQLQAIINENNVVVCDRYIASNIVYMKAKEDQQKLNIDIENFILDMEIIGNKMVVPDLSIILSMDTEKSIELQMKKQEREYTNLKQDSNESDYDLLNKCSVLFNTIDKTNYKKYIKNIKIINCLDDIGNIRSIEDISLEIIKTTLDTFENFKGISK